MASDMTSRMLEKWNAEVDIMSKINHENIVKALPTPPQLCAKANEPAPLVMEYCSGGDLRNVSVWVRYLMGVKVLLSLVLAVG